MSAYTGWQEDFLAAAGLPDTKHNRTFLSEWHQYASSDCALNPIDLTSRNSGSTKCKVAVRGRFNYQAYSRRSWARAAFAAQIKSGRYDPVRGALESGNPYGLDNNEALVQSLRDWFSPKFAQHFAEGAAAGGPPVTLKAPHALGGWKDLRKSINRGMPDTLAHSQKLNTATLRTLGRARKVRL